jgi:hypothetical protein
MCKDRWMGNGAKSYCIERQIENGTSQSSRGRFAATVGNLEARLEVTSRVHETPFIFPILVRSIVLDLPWLVECLEPGEFVSCCA